LEKLSKRIAGGKLTEAKKIDVIYPDSRWCGRQYERDIAMEKRRPSRGFGPALDLFVARAGSACQ
jgi:hypothetical protein